MTAAAAPGTERVRKEFEGRGVEFFLIYVREAHPGEHYGAHKALEEKSWNAKILAEQEGIDARILVDDLEGTIHQDYGLKPNMLYVIDKGGRVVFRALWAEETALRRALSSLLSAEERGEEVTLGEDLSILLPMVHGMSEVRRVLLRAGRQALKDFRQAMGGSALLVARATSWFRPILRTAPRMQAVVGGAVLAIPALVLLVLKNGRKQRSVRA
jgi:hypothetical protein